MPTSPTLLWGLAFAAGMLRLAVALATVDVPGDGPTRAALGWQWLQEPRLVRDGSWLPFGEISVGLSALLVPDPKWAARVLSLVTGTATVPLFASLAACVFGPAVGLAAAAALAFLPIHVTLSASSLVDAPALFFTLLALRLGLAPSDGRSRPVFFLGTALAGGIACGLRYEAWVLLLLLPLHRAFARRRPAEAVLLFALLSPLPLFWTFTALGGPSGLYAAFRKVAESGASIGGQAVPLGEAVAIALGETAVLAGPATLPLAACGLLLALGTAGKAEAAERLLWVSFWLLALLLVFLLARERGPSFVDRYALSAAVFALPLAFWALEPLLGERTRAVLLVAALVGSTGIATWIARPELYLARRFPPEIVGLAGWLDEKRAPGTAVLFTRAGWLPTYVPLFHSMRRDDYRIVSWYLQDAALRAFLVRRRPQILITREGDEAFLARIRAAGAEPGGVLARFGKLEVRELRLPGPPPRG
ncbi:MAG: glycosyltransferase family 39 protein [Geminicoccaceae bacterium]|nr:glycosyltransferase family 39 protein [Geminicoccaceae bacterium]